MYRCPHKELILSINWVKNCQPISLDGQIGQTKNIAISTSSVYWRKRVFRPRAAQNTLVELLFCLKTTLSSHIQLLRLQIKRKNEANVESESWNWKQNKIWTLYHKSRRIEKPCRPCGETKFNLVKRSQSDSGNILSKPIRAEEERRTIWKFLVGLCTSGNFLFWLSLLPVINFVSPAEAQLNLGGSFQTALPESAKAQKFDQTNHGELR